MSLWIKSIAFDEGASIPVQFTGEGRDEAPPLEWGELPAETKELALLCEDPDAPQDEPFVHWLAYRIPVQARQVPADRREGRNSFGKIGYGGPMPPIGHGAHRYIFTLYALDKEMPLEEGATKKELLRAMRGHVLEQARLIGKYERTEEKDRKAS